MTQATTTATVANEQSLAVQSVAGWLRSGWDDMCPCRWPSIWSLQLKSCGCSLDDRSKIAGYVLAWVILLQHQGRMFRLGVKR
jgi:hypothetical protein